MKNRFFLSLLSLLGFSGCSEGGSIGGGIFDEPDMYGVPLVDYRFMGEVTDADGNPIKGIEVNISSAKDAITTDSEGGFKTDFSDYADGMHSVTFTDVDGADNGGEFAEKKIEVSWDDAERVDGKDVFDLGEIKLEAKEE